MVCLVQQLRKLSTLILKFSVNFILQKIMTSLSNTLRNKRLNDIRSNLKEVPLMKKLASKLQTQKQPASSLHYIQDHDCAYEKQTNTTPSEINTSNPISRNYLLQNSFQEKYELFEKLGEGANGCVYRCQHKKNKKIFAVKKFKVSEDLLQQTKRNFLHIQRLNHPNICPYKALYFDNSQRFAYLVMQSFPHPTLQAYTPKSQDQLKLIVKQMVSAIRYLHQHHICHRDLKPDNILYDQSSGKVKIIDFGISKKTVLRGVRRDMLTIIGTNHYFAPQIYLGGGYDQRVDLWALGVTVFKLITGYTPFESQYQSNTIANILKGVIQFDRKIWDNYSPFAKDFVCRLLKPANQRLSAAECQMHFWLKSQDKRSKRNLARASSFQSFLISEQLQGEIKVLDRVKSIQKGSHNALQASVLKKIKKPIKVHNFELQESDNEEFQSSTLKNLTNLQNIF